MSKASEWAAAQARDKRPEYGQFAVVDDEGFLQICGPDCSGAIEGRRRSPTAAFHEVWTRTNPAGAIQFARWILDTFGEGS